MIIPMKHTAHFINGCAFKPSDWGDEGLPIIRIVQLTGGDLDNYFDGEVDKRYHLFDGDLLFSWSATLDSFEWQRGPALLNQHIFKVIPHQGTYQRFLYYSLKHHAPLWADVDAHGSTMRHIKRESLGNKIWLPDLKSQKMIASLLDRETTRIDALIEKKERQIALLEEKRQAVITQAVTKGLNPEAPMKDSGVEWLGEVPEHWEIKRLKFSARLNPSKSEINHRKQNLEVQFIPMTNVSEEGVVDISELKTLGEVYSGFTYCADGDVIIAKITPCFENGKGAFLSDLMNGIGFGSTEFHVLRSLGIDSEYLWFVTASEPFRAIGESEMTGAAGQQRVSGTFVADWPVCFPPQIEEQRLIINKLNAALSEILVLRKKLAKSASLLKERRAALITAAVTGQIDVREAA
jgi:type I restriction enzyme, S subunit